MKIGQLCVKIGGREAGKRCVIVDIIDDKFVLIDGQVKRRKCNIKHLEPLSKILNISKKASKEKVIEALQKEGIELKERKTKAKKEKPKKKRKKKIKENGKRRTTKEVSNTSNTK